MNDSTPEPRITTYRLSLDDKQQHVQAPSPEAAILFWALYEGYTLPTFVMATAQNVDLPVQPVSTPLAHLRNGLSQEVVAETMSGYEDQLTHCYMLWRCSACNKRFSHHEEMKVCEPCRFRLKIAKDMASIKKVGVGKTGVRHEWGGEGTPFIGMAWMMPVYEVPTEWKIHWAWSAGDNCADGMQSVTGDEVLAAWYFGEVVKTIEDVAREVGLKLLSSS